MRRKVWNEHVKLLATLLNAMAIGVMGVSVIGPLAQPRNPFFGIAEDKLAPWSDVSEKSAAFNDFLTSLPWYDIVEWKGVVIALALHVFGHAVLRGQVVE